MKTTLRLVLGLVSSLLLSAGLFRAASQLDTLSTPLSPLDQQLTGPGSTSCALPCYIVPHEKLSPSEKLS